MDKVRLTRYFIPNHWPIYAIGGASVAFTLFSRELAPFIFTENMWSPVYLLGSPFIHAGAGHLLFNVLALHYIGGMLLLPLLGTRRFLALFFLAAIVAGAANNIISGIPAVGISAAVLAMFSCALYRYAYTPMKLLFIHDLFRLRPFAMWKLGAFIVGLDVAGIVFGWGFFAHWAHLTGFAVGGVFGWFALARRRLPGRRLH